MSETRRDEDLIVPGCEALPAPATGIVLRCECPADGARVAEMRAVLLAQTYPLIVIPAKP